MNDKTHIMARLQEEFDHWEELLNNLNEEQITASNFDGGWSIKDIVAHLTAWQQVSVARLAAARSNTEPFLPAWLKGQDPELDAFTDKFNEEIYQVYRVKNWFAIHQEWKERFLRILDLAETIPDNDLMSDGKYPWMKGYPLFAVLEGTYDHHEEHLGPLQVWFLQYGNMTPGG